MPPAVPLQPSALAAPVADAASTTPPRASASTPRGASSGASNQGKQQSGGVEIRPPAHLSALNNFLHLPYIYDLSWYAIWSVYLALTPLIHLPALGAMFLYELVTGKFFLSERYVGPEDRAVIITGCDSGFGKDAALDLALSQGFTVYAGCLTEGGMAELARLYKEAREGGAGAGAARVGKLLPVQLDVTKPQHMDALFERVTRECDGRLWALVNNAGVGLSGMVDWMPEEHFRFVMEVNFHAVVAMCKRAIPLLQRQVLFERNRAPSKPSASPRPRIVNVTSMAGLYYGQACMAAYSSSKHAAEAFSSALRAELFLTGVAVCTLNPTFHLTQMVSGCVDVTEKAYRAMPLEKQAFYGEEFMQELRRVSTETAQATPWDPANVRRVLRHATTARSPKSQYVVGMDGRFLLTPLLMVPESVADGLAALQSRRDRLKPAWMLRQEQQGGEQSDGGNPAIVIKGDEAR